MRESLRHGHKSLCERGIIRNQETNLGNLSADANAFAAKSALGDVPFMVSLKNGGGIRAQIGTLSAPDPVDGTVDKLPPPENPDTGKGEGGLVDRVLAERQAIPKIGTQAHRAERGCGGISRTREDPSLRNDTVLGRCKLDVCHGARALSCPSKYGDATRRRLLCAG